MYDDNEEQQRQIGTVFLRAGVVAIVAMGIDGGAPAQIGIARYRANAHVWEIAVVHADGIDTTTLDRLEEAPAAAAKIIACYGRPVRSGD